MRRLYVIGFPLLMAFDTLAQLCFKYAGEAALPVEANTAWLLRVLSQPWVYGAILGYVGAFFTWMSLLRHAPIGPAFAASHLEVISVLLLSAWLLNEPLTLHHLVGAVLIVAGIVCLGRAEADDPHSPPQARHERAAMSLFARELPPTAGLPMQASDFLPGGGDLREILANQLGTPPLQLTCSGTHALLIALRTLRVRPSAIP